MKAKTKTKRKIINKPELLAPAGNISSLLSAIEAGADAVYFGIKNLNMRHEASNFDVLEIKKVMKRLHESGLKGYLALNVLVYDDELSKVKNIITEAKKAKVDGVICWDAAVISLAKKAGLNINISTQASVSNFEAVSFYNDLGAKKIILARECSLETIKDIVKKRNLTSYFLEIHGSPRKKREIVNDIANRHGYDLTKCLFIGDAMTDYEEAQACGTQFFGIVKSLDKSPFPESTSISVKCRLMSLA